MPALFDHNDRRRHRFWNTKPTDPTALSRRGGAYFRPGTNRVLGPDSFMPIGEHASKHMRAVPLEYLLWVHAQPWAKHWDSWQPVTTYLENYVLPDHETSDTLPDMPTPTFYLDRVRRWPTKIKCFKDGNSHLHCLPGHEDFLHAFAVGGLNLSRDWYQPGSLPHYDLTTSRHEHALRLGAVLIDDPQLVDHKNTWIDFFRSKPRMTDLPTPPRLPHRLA